MRFFLIACVLSAAMVTAALAFNADSAIGRMATTATAGHVKGVSIDGLKRVHFLVSCDSWPYSVGNFIGATQIQIKRQVVNSRRVWIHACQGNQCGSIECHSLGVYSTRRVYTCRGAQALAQAIAALPTCPVAVLWKDVPSLPQAAKDWLKGVSVCHGEAYYKGTTVYTWPCRWQGTRPDFSVGCIGALSPGILAGGSGRSAAGITAEDPICTP
jgi:hypothetical protein